MANNPSDEDEGVADLDAGVLGLQLTGDAMLLDNFDDIDEKQDVAIISPDGSVDESELDPLADDCTLYSVTKIRAGKVMADWLSGLDEAMKARVLPELPDQETESEAVFTWKIEGWRSMEKKSRGPTFQCGGYPWLVSQ